jgi:SAM-dependent methyltransferase
MAIVKRLGQAVLGFTAAYTAMWLWERRHPRPCPYGIRFVLMPPRPFIGRGRLVEALAARPGERILEIGPGIGYYTATLAQEVHPDGVVDIFDVQQEFLDHTMRDVAGRGLDNVRPTRGDAGALPFDEDSFDAVVLITVLGELPDQDRTLAEISRVLRPGGRLLVGEEVRDPDFVPYRELCRLAAAARLRPEGRRGPPIGYFARLVKPEAGPEPA